VLVVVLVVVAIVVVVVDVVPVARSPTMSVMNAR
jgi:hypothetical protein